MKKKAKTLVDVVLEGSIPLDKNLNKMTEQEVRRALNRELEGKMRKYHVTRLYARFNELRRRREFRQHMQAIGHY